MARRYPTADSPDAFTAALVARMATVDTRLDELDSDVTAIGHHLAKVLAALNGKTVDEDAEPDTPTGTPDWWACHEVEDATTWLAALAAWTRGPGACLALELHPCWPLHPTTVDALLVAKTVRDAAYASDRPDQAADWLHRWAPATRKTVAADLKPCDGGHGKPSVRITRLDLGHVATWWCTDRTTDPMTALNLWRQQ